jgi:hypothetical protein
MGKTATQKSPTHHRQLLMQAPTIAQIRTAIEVLKKFSEHINTNAANEVIGLNESPHSDRQAARIGSRTIDQTTRIEAVAGQLENWRDELLQQRRQCVSQRI